MKKQLAMLLLLFGFAVSGFSGHPVTRGWVSSLDEDDGRVWFSVDISRSDHFAGDGITGEIVTYILEHPVVDTPAQRDWLVSGFLNRQNYYTSVVEWPSKPGSSLKKPSADGYPKNGYRLDSTSHPQVLWVDFVHSESDPDLIAEVLFASGY